MEIRQLEVFLAVMSAGSITAAAKVLDRSQSQVTRLIQDLEVSTGFALFERNGPRITPTPRAIRFHADAERFLSGIGQLKERAGMIAAEEPGPIEIAAIPAFASGIVPLALAAMEEESLPRSIHLRSVAAESAIQSVLARTSDFCVASLPVSWSGLEIHGLFQRPCVAAVCESDPLAMKPSISARDLAGRCVVTMANPYRLRRRVDLAFQAAGIAPSRIVDTNATVNAVQLASTGMGVAIVDPATAYGIRIANVVIRPLEIDIPFLWGVFSALSKPLPESATTLIQNIVRISNSLMAPVIQHDPRHIDRMSDLIFGAGDTSKDIRP